MIKFNIIKESDLDLPILKECLNALPRGEYFKGSTHYDYKLHGEAVAGLEGQNFGYIREKNGVAYWVLPYPSNPSLDVVRKEGEEVICVSLTETELLNFGFDIPADEVY